MSFYTINIHSSSALANGVSKIEIAHGGSIYNIPPEYYTIHQISHSDGNEYSIKVQITENNHIIQCNLSNNNNNSSNNNNCQPENFSLRIYGASITPVLSVQIDFNITDTTVFYQIIRNFFIEIQIKLRYNRNYVDIENITINAATNYSTYQYIDYRIRRRYSFNNDIFGKTVVSEISRKNIIDNQPRYTSSLCDVFNNWDHIPFLALQDKTFVHNHDSQINDKIVKTKLNKYNLNLRVTGVTDKDITRLYEEIENTSNTFLGPGRGEVFLEYPLSPDGSQTMSIYHASYMALTRTGVHKIFERTPFKELYFTSDIKDLGGGKLSIGNKTYLAITPKVYVGINYIDDDQQTVLLGSLKTVILDFLIQDFYGGFILIRDAATVQLESAIYYALVILPIDTYTILIGIKSKDDSRFEARNIQGIYDAAIFYGELERLGYGVVYLTKLMLIDFNDLVNHNGRVDTSKVKRYLSVPWAPNVRAINEGNLSVGANLNVVRWYDILISFGNLSMRALDRALNTFVYGFYKNLSHVHNTEIAPNTYRWLRPRYDIFYKNFIQ